MLNGSINYTDLKLMKRCKQKCDAEKYSFSFLPLKSLKKGNSSKSLHFVFCIFERELSILLFATFCKRLVAVMSMEVGHLNGNITSIKLAS
jgi:hypothetical protein